MYQQQYFDSRYPSLHPSTGEECFAGALDCHCICPSMFWDPCRRKPGEPPKKVPCHSDRWRCANGRCIPKHYICDGYAGKPAAVSCHVVFDKYMTSISDQQFQKKVSSDYFFFLRNLYSFSCHTLKIATAGRTKFVPRNTGFVPNAKMTRSTPAKSPMGRRM